LAAAALKRLFEIIEAILRNLCFGYILCCGDNSGVRSLSTSQNPDVLSLEKEEGLFARINNWVVGVISVQYTVVSGPENKEADLAMSTLAFCGSFNVVDFSFVELRVVNLNKSVTSQWVFCLRAVSIFKENAFVSHIFMPRTKVLVDVEVLFKSRLRALSKAELSIDRFQESKSGNSCCDKECR